MRDLTEGMDLSIKKNKEFFYIIFPGYKLEFYAKINFEDIKFTLDMNINNKEQFGAKGLISNSEDIKSIKLFYKGKKVKIDGITNSKKYSSLE